MMHNDPQAATSQPIYNQQALERYHHRSSPAVLPPHISLKMLRLLWLCVVLCIALQAVFWLVEVPLYETKPFVVSPDSPGTIIVLRLDATSHIAPGQEVYFNKAQIGRISAVTSDVDQRQELLGDSWRTTADQAIAIVTLSNEASFLSEVSEIGNGVLQIETGHTRLGAFIPILGPMFQ